MNAYGIERKVDNLISPQKRSRRGNVSRKRMVVMAIILIVIGVYCFYSVYDEMQISRGSTINQNTNYIQIIATVLLISALLLIIPIPYDYLRGGIKDE